MADQRLKKIVHELYIMVHILASYHQKHFVIMKKIVLNSCIFQKRVNYKGPISVQCRYYMPDFRGWPDLVGLLQATSDILTTAGVILDDMWITDYNGSEIVGVDKHNPRVEIQIDYAKPPHVLHEIWNRRNSKK